jgi:hypothetical protein
MEGGGRGLLTVRNYLVEHYGIIADTASIVGLAVSNVGFILTVRSSRKAEKSASEAREAAVEVVQRIRMRFLADELGSAIKLLEEVERLCREKKWNSAENQTSEPRTKLARIGAAPRLLTDEKSLLEAYVSDLGSFLSYLARLRSEQTSRDLPAPKLKNLHEMIVGLCRAQARLQDATMETGHYAEHR